MNILKRFVIIWTLINLIESKVFKKVGNLKYNIIIKYIDIRKFYRKMLSPSTSLKRKKDL